ncbi:MAG: superoxide dismutase family protein [Rhodothermales bacterium]
MNALSLSARRPLFLALFALLLFPACSTTERAADTTADAAEDVGDFTVNAAEETAEFAADVGETVYDAAGTAWDATTDLFDDDDDLDAAALVRPTSAGSAQGTVKFYEMDDALRVTISLRDLDPGMHGFHIHQNPSCDAADTDGDGMMEPAGAAGGHWDPHNTNNHGAPTENVSDKHAGDLGNIEAGPDGTATTTFTVTDFDHDVDGRAIVVHSGRDDLETDPAGGAGTPVACGVIMDR